MTPTKLFIFNRPAHFSCWPREYTLQILHLFFAHQDILCTAPGTKVHMFLSSQGDHHLFTIDSYKIRLLFESSVGILICSFEEIGCIPYKNMQISISYLDLLEAGTC